MGEGGWEWTGDFFDSKNQWRAASVLGEIQQMLSRNFLMVILEKGL